MKTLKLENLKLHVIIWALFILYELSVSLSFGARLSSFPDYAGHYLLNIGLFYVNAHIVLPNVVNYNKKPYLTFLTLPLSILAELGAYMLLKFLLLNLLSITHFHVSRPITDARSFFIESIWRAIYFIGLSTGYWLALSTIHDRKRIADLENINLRNELENQVLEKTLLATENAYLRAQINPHFLLNTLNFIYNSVSKYSEKVADSIMLLADMMRYALTSADKDGKVKLESEIENINNFIQLNQARFNQQLCINFKVDGDPGDLRIIPLVLITLVENVFKYGDLSMPDCPAKVELFISGNALTCITVNNKKKAARAHGYGIGIENIKKRLAAYHKYELCIEDNEGDYKSTLKIELQ
jgi:two-component system, LytTR family, sensor kinase